MKATRCTRFLAATALSCTVTIAGAQTAYTCTGVPRGVALGVEGNVFVESLGGLAWAGLCNTINPANGISPAACKSIYASLLLAQATGRPMTLWFNSTVGSCAANPAWGWAPGFYFSRMDG